MDYREAPPPTQAPSMSIGDSPYAYSLSRRWNAGSGPEPSEERTYLESLRASLQEMVSGCVVCRFATKENAWEGLYCVVHRSPVRADQSRCDSFERRESRLSEQDSKEQIRGYVTATLGIRGPNLRRLTG